MLTQERSGLTKAWDLTTVRNAAFYVMIEVPVSASKLGVSCELNTLVRYKFSTYFSLHLDVPNSC